VWTPNDATTSTEKETVEVVADSVVTTWFDGNLISASKRAWPLELVTTMGKVRGVVGQSTEELRKGPGEPSCSDFVKSTSDPVYEGMGVTVRTEWNSSTGA